MGRGKWRILSLGSDSRSSNSSSRGCTSHISRCRSSSCSLGLETGRLSSSASSNSNTPLRQRDVNVPSEVVPPSGPKEREPERLVQRMNVADTMDPAAPDLDEDGAFRHDLALQSKEGSKCRTE